MKTYYLSNLTNSQIKNLIRRKNISSEKLYEVTRRIVNDVKKNGLQAAIKYAKQFDGFSSKEIYVTEKEFAEAERLLSPQLITAIKKAYHNIYKFHKKQTQNNYSMETMDGVRCERKFLPIENVGLYIPSGTAPLPSTMLMLGVPAKIAGCKRIVAATPTKDKIHPAILFAAKLCGINEIIKIGGAQGIALLAYGDYKIKKVDKIFGPGNQYVTAAKSLVSIDPNGCSIDMIAGPSEVLVIADEFANPVFVAADLLSQAEHGKDSLAILVTTSEKLFDKVQTEIKNQLKSLPRKNLAEASLKNSFALIVKNDDEAIYFSNLFAPEHLIINTKNANRLADKVVNAGSVFVGDFTPESAGDYA
ncbi:MAG: histidinol dehydrogenase, partial [Ignavibacterium sp.]